ncbi:MAG: 4-hydroxy-3-methylbut-2-enyl diphosphate reductase [Clostridia bacterium]|nr:4-hydroxy-3-methylbut-2-enyl diphosphate reductase [Clostridia bacterium]
MIVLIGKNSGFCFGVKRAIDAVNNISCKRKFVLGEIIHNELVTKSLNESGLKIINDIKSANLQKGDTVVIRTHGETKSVFEKLNKLGVNIIDCTCPFVKKIQNIVEEHYNKGYKIAIIGNANHPEVVGVNGWCNNSAIITENLEDLHNINAEKLCVVVQTTYNEEKFEKINKNFTFKLGKIVDIFKTICYTTSKRQKEAEIISKNCQAVIVLGGSNSNNTKELFDLCKQHCSRVFHISVPKDFDYDRIKKYKKVGIVLGASTPIEQFKEVICNMEKVTEEIIKTEVVDTEVSNEPAVEEVKKVSLMEKAFQKIKPAKDYRVGQVVVATISSANDSGLTISLKNSKGDFVLPKDEMINEYNKEEYKDKIGSDIRVMVIGKNPIRFSEKAMAKILAEEAEIELIKNGKVFEAEIIETNKGGLTGKFGSFQVFIPASQIKIGFVKDLEKFVGKKLKVKAEKVESRVGRRQIVASARVILEEEKAIKDAERAELEKEFFDNIQVGDVVLGKPVRFAAFGAFIDINGIDCLAHISDLSWTGCNDCAEVLELNKEYEFKILKIDLETKRVSVGFKQLQPKPWDSVEEKYAVGDVVKGKVVRIVPFGAFVEVEKGVDGLIHVSQISNKWLENPISVLQVGQEVEAKILEINVEKEKMNLSIKVLLPEEAPVEEEKEEKSAKSSKKRSAKKVEEDEELREWKDETNSDVSIADLINSDKE